MIIKATVQKRLDYVINKKPVRPEVVSWVLWAVVNALGLEQQIKARWKGTGHSRVEWHLGPFPSTEFEVRQKLGLTDRPSYAPVAERIAKRDVIDPYIPWLATRLNKLGNPPRELLNDLIRSFRSICIWASETKANISQLSLQEALDQSRGYVPNAARKGKQDSEANPVVYRFEDKHKVVQLKTPEALKREGDVMKHCVGDYCDAVEEGTSEIYSLRTEAGDSLVTVEINPASGHVEQVFGPENQDPSDEEMVYVLEFLRLKKPKAYKGKRAIDKLTPPEELAELAKDEDLNVRRHVAKNVATTAEALRGLARDAGVNRGRANDADFHLCRNLARNPSTPGDVLEALADAELRQTGTDRAERQDILVHVAQNPSSPARLLDKLARPEPGNKLIRIYVAKNPSTPASALESLAKEGDKHINAALAENRSTPSEVFELLFSRHKSDALEVPQPSLRYLLPPVREHEELIASNRSAPGHVLAEIASLRLAQLINESERQDQRIAAHQVLQRLTGNPSTPDVVLSDIAEKWVPVKELWGQDGSPANLGQVAKEKLAARQTNSRVASVLLAVADTLSRLR